MTYRPQSLKKPHIKRGIHNHNIVINKGAVNYIEGKKGVIIIEDIYYTTTLWINITYGYKSLHLYYSVQSISGLEIIPV